MPLESAFMKGRRLFAEARVHVLRASRELIIAAVRGDSGRVYGCGFENGSWSCDCAARTPRCAHVIALQLIWVEPGARP